MFWLIVFASIETVCVFESSPNVLNSYLDGDGEIVSSPFRKTKMEDCFFSNLRIASRMGSQIRTVHFLKRNRIRERKFRDRCTSFDFKRCEF
ncbi:hypothetical protein CH380_14765 [Leptospira adleri]|uniref:Uncharacterized protein n=1 Tax=Leptospira adleri TaxID=2023186 RepID=A0A2M9YLM0_9LEPT|nr:hypothetical protein CH380_14765 [Leptospira adleri]PJZ63602.1 hypothetical protein CH376_01785 [Leptospira adleri]